MPEMRFDFNNMFSLSIGSRHGVTEQEFKALAPALDKARRHILSLLKDEKARVRLGLEWARLAYQQKSEIDQIQRLGLEIAKKFQNVIFLGIGGSFLGLKAAQDALCPPYYNEFSANRGKLPRIFFEGNNLDPDTLGGLLKNLDPRKTLVVVISKSGETIETKAAFSVVEKWLQKKVGSLFGRQIIAITDPDSGALRKKVTRQNSRDALSFRSLPLKKGVGGRFSELNMGLLHLAVAGVDIRELLKGAARMDQRLKSATRNPALAYAGLQTILYKKKSKSIAIMMPFSETLKSTADWYVQLLAESLGKKYARKITKNSHGQETWGQDMALPIHTGRTPIAARGTNDLHSIQQNTIEGENNKTVTFMRVERFRQDFRLEAPGDFLQGKKFSQLMNLAQEATEWALVREQRPNCTIILPEVNAYHWGELIYFLEMATAYEGELLNVNAFDQPGVEGYKNYLYYKLAKPGLACEISSGIRNNPLVKNKKFIL